VLVYKEGKIMCHTSEEEVAIGNMLFTDTDIACADLILDNMTCVLVMVDGAESIYLTEGELNYMLLMLRRARTKLR
jgi:hypothetical protein